LVNAVERLLGTRPIHERRAVTKRLTNSSGDTRDTLPSFWPVARANFPHATVAALIPSRVALWVSTLVRMARLSRHRGCELSLMATIAACTAHQNPLRCLEAVAQCQKPQRQQPE